MDECVFNCIIYLLWIGLASTFFQSIIIEDCQQLFVMNHKRILIPDSVDRIVNNVIAYSSLHGNLLTKFSQDFYLAYFDRRRIITAWEAVLMLGGRQGGKNRQISVQDFIRVMLLTIKHQQFETLYLAMSLRNLFQRILEETPYQKTIHFSDFTNFLCQKISKDDLEVVIPAKKIPLQKMSPDPGRVRDIDLDPTIILNKVQKEAPKLSKEMRKKNKKLDQNKAVSQFIYAPDSKSIIALGTLSSSIFIYDIDLRSKRQIQPNESKQMDKDIAILSIAYCRKMNRIGAIINNIGLLFWQGSDNFNTQKAITSKSYGQTIYYLNLFGQWVTVDKNTLYFWDLKDEVVTRQIKRMDSAFINDICQLNHLRSLCVSYTTTTQQKLLVIYYQDKQVAQIDLGTAGCHTLHYNPFTQCLIPIGYQSTIQIYQVESLMFDVELKMQLRGHKSIITCVDSIQGASLIITGDDVGEIRIWELNYMRCLQALKVAKWLTAITFVGNKLIFSDTRLNVLDLDHFQINKIEDLYGLYQFYQEESESLWIITRKDARKIDLKNGKTTKIFVICGDQEQISSSIRLKSGFLIGNSKGQLHFYDEDGNKKWWKQAHQGEVCQLRFDDKNRFIFSVGSDNRILLWPQKTAINEQHRKSITYKNKNINILQISTRSNLLAVASNEDREVAIWDYEVIKLYEILEFSAEISCITLSEEFNFIIIATNDQKIHFIKYSQKQMQMEFQLLKILTYVNENHLTKSTLKLMKKEAELVTSMKLVKQKEEERATLLVGTSKGLLINFDISDFIEDNFKVNGPQMKKEAANMQRPSREEYDAAAPQKYKKKIPITPQAGNELISNSQIYLNWQKCIHKDAINSIELIQFKSLFISTLCVDFYNKITQIQSGAISCSMNINLPLPIQWNMKVEKYSYVKKNIYQTLKIIDSILKNQGYEMLVKEYKLINISQFMEMIKRQKITAIQMDAAKPIKTLREQYSPQDILGKGKKEATLKSLEAYKRVKMIKNANQKQMEFKEFSYSSNAKDHPHYKQFVTNFLSPNYLPELLNRGVPQPTTQLSERTLLALDQTNLFDAIKMKNPTSKKDGKQNTGLCRKSSRTSIQNLSMDKSTLTHLSHFKGNHSVLIEEKRKQEKMIEINQKPIQSILTSLNQKLMLHKKNRFLKHNQCFNQSSESQ